MLKYLSYDSHFAIIPQFSELSFCMRKIRTTQTPIKNRSNSSLSKILNKKFGSIQNSIFKPIYYPSSDWSKIEISFLFDLIENMVSITNIIILTKNKNHRKIHS
jgi:hypothetical protein